MSKNHFVYNPSTVDIRRSKFLVNNFWKGDLYHGDLVPIEITEILPGDSLKYDVAAFIRTATPPIAPFMDSVRLNIAGFFVPERLVNSKVKEFYGENTEGYGIQSEVLMPRSSLVSMTVPKTYAATTLKRSIGTYLGLVRQKDTAGSNGYSPIALNPIRCFLQVYNDWFRNENFMAPYLWDHSQTGDNASRYIATLNGNNISCQSDLPKVCKQLDRYTSCLPWAQKGAPVLIGFADEAPIIAGDDIHDLGGDMRFVASADTESINPGGGWLKVTQADSGNKVIIDKTAAGSQDIFDIDKTNLVADLGEATAMSINEIRLAFATQRYLEQLARSGSKYREYIKGMFGVNIGDTTAQMAEYLGGMTIELNIDQVLQTTDYSAGATTKLGAPGASSTSAASQYLFTKSFQEPGFLVVVAYTKHNRTYGQGIDEIYQKHEILERYNPKFANIGETAIKKSNIYFSGDVDDDDIRLGFQEAWSEYRYKKDMIVGAMAPSNSSSFNFWSLAENFASAPTLNADFLTEDRTNIARALAGGINGPDYFLDLKIKRTFVRPMPLYSIPGLIDHH